MIDLSAEVSGELRQEIAQIKSQRSCWECGETDPERLLDRCMHTYCNACYSALRAEYRSEEARDYDDHYREDE